MNKASSRRAGLPAADKRCALLHSLDLLPPTIRTPQCFVLRCRLTPCHLHHQPNRQTRSLLPPPPPQTALPPSSPAASTCPPTPSSRPPSQERCVCRGMVETLPSHWARHSSWMKHTRCVRGVKVCWSGVSLCAMGGGLLAVLWG